MVTACLEGGDPLLVFPRMVHNVQDWLGSCSVAISYSATRFRLLSWIEWPAEQPPTALSDTPGVRPPVFATSPQVENDLYGTWSEVMLRTYGIPVSTRALQVLVAKYIAAPEMPLQQLLELAAIGLRAENYPSRSSYLYVRNKIFELVVLSRVFRTMIAITDREGQWIAASPGDEETGRQCFGSCVLKMAPSGSVFAVQEVIRWHVMQYTEPPPDPSDAAALLYATRRMQAVSEIVEEEMGVLHNLHVPVSAPYVFGASLFASLSSSSSSSTRRSRTSHMSGAAHAVPGTGLCAELQANTSPEATLISEARPTIPHAASGGARGIKRRKHTATHALPPRETPSGCGARGSAQGQDLRVPHGCLLTWPAWLHPQENEMNSRDMFNICLTLEEQLPKYIAVPDEWSRPLIEHAIADHLSVAHSWLLFDWEGNCVSVTPAACFPRVSGKTYDDLYDSCVAMPAPRGRRPGMFSSELIIGHRGSRKRGLTKFTTEHPGVSRAMVRAANQFSPHTTFNAIAIVHHRQVPIHRDVMNDALHQMVLVPLQGESWLWVESATGSDILVFDDEELTGSWHPFTRAFSFMGAAAHALRTEDPCCSLAMYRTARMPRYTHAEELHHLGFNLSDAEIALLDRGEPLLPSPTEDEASSSESIPAEALADAERAVRDDASACESEAAAPDENAVDVKLASEPEVEIITDPELSTNDQVVKVSFAKSGRGATVVVRSSVFSCVWALEVMPCKPGSSSRNT
eukprot:3630207-Amphidinium_carterae.3